jgi:hypothetical protein
MLGLPLHKTPAGNCNGRYHEICCLRMQVNHGPGCMVPYLRFSILLIFVQQGGKSSEHAPCGILRTVRN